MTGPVAGPSSGAAGAGEHPRSRWFRGENALWVAALAACGVCCAGPVIAVLAAIGLTSAAAAVAVPGLAVAAVAAGLSVWWLRRRSRRRCAAPADGAVALLPFPTVRAMGDGRPE